MDDALSNLLHGVRPEGALFDRSALLPPWSLRFAQGTPLALLTVLSGEAWVMSDGHTPVRLTPCDVAIVTGPEPYTVADDPGTPPLARYDGVECTVLGPDGHPATTPAEAARAAAMCLAPDTAPDLSGAVPGPRPPGLADPADHADPAGTGTVLLKGVYRVRGSVSDRVLSALPRIALLPAVPEGCMPLEMIAQELRRNVPGQQVVLDRLLDLLLVTSLREWFALPGSGAPAWYRAHTDPLVGHALRLMHGDPAHPWTVASLAGAAGASRARFAHRFTELVGRSPMAYLTEWRICWAADLLARTDSTVDAVSRQVGYSNAYALSVAFKRIRGVRPSEHRALARTGA
ncbi:AraC family transcriptional regulator [Streptomyces yaizuensis]|uniref:AraC family transcriptional regulator n=1 Tax=Streptomyces yaizuensis TaxID=2989713 RepID=A0ABQ5P444_9ACTN|nr:AraC family transcriptional regulator [Streptomyces sp. YSPA8]GLF97329.1 AraC family transcriptional regulator [Streptomyces sp. YSPA8]